MKFPSSPMLQLGALVALFAAMSASAATRYVNVNSASPTAPYTDWASAAATIQDAVDAALAGDQILVTNGVYRTGGREVFEAGGNTNRVAVTKPILVRSVNGAGVTLIQGDRGRYPTDSQAGLRCVYLGSGAALVGFTLTQGAASVGGGVYCQSSSAVVSDCVLTGNRANNGGNGDFGNGGGAYGGTMSNCILSTNSASRGGGSAGTTLNNCTLSGNSAGWGGGASGGTLNHCTVTRNSTTFYGNGGGAYDAILNNCIVSGNSTATGWGGGALNCTLNNCTLTGNSAWRGGGSDGSTLNNCTLTGNSAFGGGGGVNSGTLNNCIVYSNSSPNAANYDNATFSYSCTTPLPTNGIGNLTGAPLFVDYGGGNLRLQSNSPCVNAGSNDFAPDGPDLDGSSRIVGGTVDIGAYEFGSPLPPPPLLSPIPTRYVNVNSTSPAPPYTNWMTAATTIQDAIDVAAPGDQILVTNGVYQTGRGVVPAAATPNRVAVTKPLMLRSVNGATVTVIQGYREPGASAGDSARGRCVYLANGATLVGFTLTNGWVAQLFGHGGGVWCESASEVVSNCVMTGNSVGIDGSGGGVFRGTLYNCTLTGNSAAHFGFGGGGAAGSTLYNCTLTGNSTDDGHGGGVVFSTLNNCILTGNSAIHGEGGGAYKSTLNNCTLTGNAAGGGGAVGESALNNCTLTANSATSDSGGAYLGTLNNCIVYYNNAPNGANYFYSLLSYSCTTPLPTNGIGNFTSAPLFVNQSGGNLRLQPDSPGINAGSNAFAPDGPDLDGNPRVAGGTVDIGAYEFQSPESLLSYAWLQQYSYPNDGSTDYDDPDGDGLSNWQEWRSGTSPINAFSVLRLLSPISSTSGLIVRWQSVSGLIYFLERGTDLEAQSPFLPLASGIAGQPGTTTFTDTTAVGAGPFFYRVGVQE